VLPFPCTGKRRACVSYSYVRSAGETNGLLSGASLGLGLDWALILNLFLRSEFEFIWFAPLATINVSIVTARVDAGLKF
jgi:hypothetical protein